MLLQSEQRSSCVFAQIHSVFQVNSSEARVKQSVSVGASQKIGLQNEG